MSEEVKPSLKGNQAQFEAMMDVIAKKIIRCKKIMVEQGLKRAKSVCPACKRKSLHISLFRGRGGVPQTTGFCSTEGCKIFWRE